jgi:endonuclease YncB( thermonuclease family)
MHIKWFQQKRRQRLERRELKAMALFLHPDDKRKLISLLQKFGWFQGKAKKQRSSGIFRYINLFIFLFIAVTLIFVTTYSLEFFSPPKDVFSFKHFPQEQADEYWLVLKVIDGDTIIASRGEAQKKVRFLNVDTQESASPISTKNTIFGKETGDYVSKKLLDQKIKLECEGVDIYRRQLCYVWFNNENFNVQLVREGWSLYVTKYGKSKYDEEFLKAEKEAQSNKKGIWRKS